MAAGWGRHLDRLFWGVRGEVVQDELSWEGEWVERWGEDISRKLEDEAEP